MTFKSHFSRFSFLYESGPCHKVTATGGRNFYEAVKLRPRDRNCYKTRDFFGKWSFQDAFAASTGPKSAGKIFGLRWSWSQRMFMGSFDI